MPRSTDELIARSEELADEFEAYEPAPGDHHEPPLMAVRRLVYKRSLLERNLLEAVRDAREAGATWSRIGQELGTAGEAVRQRYADEL